jgi:two-component system phosphate regulon response regulator PhoB
MKKIMLVEDDHDLFEALKYSLQREKFQFVGIDRGNGAIQMCCREKPDLVLLDILLPDCSGLEICKRIREHGDLRGTPVIFLTALAEEADRVVGLELGANDYVVKPFSMRELFARIRVHLRRVEDSSNVSRVSNIELDRSRCQVTVDGAEVSLTATELRLLDCLMNRPGVVFSREQLLNFVWGNNRNLTDRAVDVYILRLRRKLQHKNVPPDLIKAVRGFGYTLSASQAQSA